MCHLLPNTLIVHDDGSASPCESDPPDQKAISTIEDLIDTCFMGVYRQHAGGFWTSSSPVQQMERVVRFYEVLRRQMPPQYADRIATAMEQ